MKPYQKEYLELLSAVNEIRSPMPTGHDPDAFVEECRSANRKTQALVERGTRLLREELFPVLDNILSVTDEEADSLYEFAGALMSGVMQKDVGLHYRIHLAIMSRARRLGLRDTLIRELYLVGMSLHNLETMLSPNQIRLYTSRMRMCFAESASYFETDYDDITDPETRGYIHRSMGNIALSYDGADERSANEKLAVISRSIRLLSDPDIRAKTPSLPWDLYLYKSHQERTTLLNYLRSGNAGPDAFAQILESAQIVESRQQKAAREKGVPLQPRWQYAYMAARYHCGAMLLTDFLEGIYGLSVSCDEDDLGANSMFTHIDAPAIYMAYTKKLPNSRIDVKTAERIIGMTKRMCSWIVRAPSSESNEQLMFYLRQFLYSYIEFPGGMPFYEVLLNAFAARHPAIYVRMLIAGRISEQLAVWAVEDCPEELVGLLGCASKAEVRDRRAEIAEFARNAGTLHDTGMIHFINLDTSACRELFEEEAALIRLHTHCGSQLLKQHSSTEIYADVALGHHRRFDEKGGYPTDFSPSSSSSRAAIYIVAAAGTLASSTGETFSRYSPVISFEQACDKINAGCGTRFARFVAMLIAPEERRRQLKHMIDIWKQEAFIDMYRRRACMT